MDLDRITTLVRRALAEVCTVPVLLVIHGIEILSGCVSIRKLNIDYRNPFGLYTAVIPVSLG